MPTRYTKEILQEAVNNSVSFADVARYFNVAPHGGNNTYLSRLIKKHKINTSHFNIKISIGKQYNRYARNNSILGMRKIGHREKGYNLKAALLEIGREYKCVECGIQNTWNNKEIKLQIHHVDGHSNNNYADNLVFLCPNCHSQTDNFCAKKNKQNRVYKCVCGNIKSRQAILCKNCRYKNPTDKQYKGFLNKTKIDWPADEVLREKVSNQSLSKIGAELGVTANAVKKRCKKCGIELERYAWQKNREKWKGEC